MAPGGDRARKWLAPPKIVLPSGGVFASPPSLPSDLMSRLAQDVEGEVLPAFLPPMCASSLAHPRCVSCLQAMSWNDWRLDCVLLPLGRGLFSARCVACRGEEDRSSFKDECYAP